MKPDPPIDEIRAVRHRISEEFGHDTRALLDHYRELEKRHPGRFLRRRPRPQRPEPEAPEQGSR
jgi:hypothetical protein